MKYISILALVLTSCLTPVFAGLPPTTIKGQSGSKATNFNFQTPYNQATKTAAVTALIETGNDNLLVNPSFEHQTYSTGWTIAGSSGCAVSTANVSQGRQAGNCTSFSGPGDAVYQYVTPTIETAGKNMQVSIDVAALDPSVFVCSVVNAVEQQCQEVAVDGVLRSYTFNVVVPNSTAFGIKIKTTTASLRSIKFDNGYAGVARNLANVPTATSRKSYTPTISGFGTVSNNSAFYWIVGNTLHIQGSFNAGTTGASVGRIGFPSGLVMSTASLTATQTANLGTITKAIVTTGTPLPVSAVGPWILTNDNSDTSSVAVSSSTNTSANQFVLTNGNTVAASGDSLSYEFAVPITSGSTTEVMNANLYNWAVDALVYNDPIQLGSLSVGSYRGLENSSLTLINTVGAGIIPAQVGCSGTNPPTGTTCSAGFESVAVSWVMPETQDVYACATFTHTMFDTSGAVNMDVNANFKIVETAINSQTVLQDFGYAVVSRFGTNSGGGGEVVITGTPTRLCGRGRLAAGQRMLRLMYTQAVSGTVGVNELEAAGVHWQIYPINQAVPAPILVSGVTTPNKEQNERIARAYGRCGAASALYENPGTWITNITNISSGTCTITLAAGTFAQYPQCVISINNNTATDAEAAMGCASATACTMGFTAGGGSTAAQADWNIICMGPR